MRIDVHQHLVTEPLAGALSARRSAPRLRRHGCAWELELAGEEPAGFDLAGEDPARRTQLVHLDGLDTALVSLSGALGIEELPADEATTLLDAHHEGVRALPRQFGGWASVPLTHPEAALAVLEYRLDEGFCGLSLPGRAIASPAGLERARPLLELLERRGLPLFVHPGPAAGEPGRPAWWPALTAYVAEMAEAWYSFIAAGRPAHPLLRVAFALLAGCAPLQLERLRSRGGPAERAFDNAIFYDTSSYGERAIDAMVRAVGVDQLVHGSDRPVVAPLQPPGPLGEAAWATMTQANPARLLGTAA